MVRDRTLGATGLRVSEIGFGAWGIGGTTNEATAYGPTNDAESRRALQRAFDVGVTFYDTAPLYGHGHSEQLIGEVLGAVRSRVVIASKAGLLNSAGDHDFSLEGIRRALAQSLRNLHTDYLDLYQLHDPPREILDHDEVWALLSSLKRAGTIRAYGVSVRAPSDLTPVLARGGVGAVQVNFNMLDQRVLEQDLLGQCQTAGIGVIARTPLCFGFLTGAYAPDSAFDPQDHRSRWSVEQRAVWAEAHRRFESIRARREQTPAHLALRFCLSYAAVSTAIPGMLTTQHVEENIAASRLGPLEESEREEIERVYRQHQFFLGTSARHVLSR